MYEIGGKTGHAAMARDDLAPRRQRTQVRTPFAGTWETSVPSCGVARRIAPVSQEMPTPEMRGRRS